MDAISKKSLYSDEVYQSCRSRIEKLTPQTLPEWGSMTSAQMLAHCAEILEVSNGKELLNTPMVARLFKGMIRKMVVSEKPYSEGTDTHPQYKQTVDRDFDTEMVRLLAALAEFKSLKGAAIVHPLFGAMTVEEKGWSTFKHLDHHLRQFGV